MSHMSSITMKYLFSARNSLSSSMTLIPALLYLAS
uniref:Uncharacterized protein n=1 Tax=Arundo donax TaxID=35708 RepID=A0A0A9PZ58_ARUDO